MSMRVIRAIGWVTSGSHANPVQPRLDVAAFPHSAPSLLSFALNCVVSSVRVLRPIHGQSIPHEPFAKIGTADRARRYCAPVAVEIDWIAAHRPPRDECIEVVGCLRAAAVWIAVFAPAELRTLWCIDAPQPDARAVYFQRVAINHTRLPDHVVGRRSI